MSTDDANPGNPGRAYLLVAGCFFFGGVSAWLGVMKHLAKLPHYLVAVCILSALLTIGLVGLLEREDERSDRQLKKQLGWVIYVYGAGIILAFVGLISLGMTSAKCGDIDSCGPSGGPFGIAPLAPLTVVQGHRSFQAGDARAAGATDGSHSLHTPPDSPRPHPTFAVVTGSPPDSTRLA